MQAACATVDPQGRHGRDVWHVLHRWAQVQGRLVGVDDDLGGAHINRLSHRYFGRDYPGPRTDRVTVRIAPERVTGGDNRQPWDAD